MSKPTLFPKPFRLSRDWMDQAERRTFERMRETDQISFFRTNACAGPGCDNEVPKVKLYCSVKCKKKHEKEIEEDRAES